MYGVNCYCCCDMLCLWYTNTWNLPTFTWIIQIKPRWVFSRGELTARRRYARVVHSIQCNARCRCDDRWKGNPKMTVCRIYSHCGGRLWLHYNISTLWLWVRRISADRNWLSRIRTRWILCWRISSRILLSRVRGRWILCRRWWRIYLAALVTRLWVRRCSWLAGIWLRVRWRRLSGICRHSHDDTSSGTWTGDHNQFINY